MKFIIEYYAADREYASDCHPDFFESREAAEREAATFMAELPWAVRWSIREVSDAL